MGGLQVGWSSAIGVQNAVVRTERKRQIVPKVFIFAE
jgi:hypothetical protein